DGSLPPRRRRGGPGGARSGGGADRARAAQSLAVVSASRSGSLGAVDRLIPRTEARIMDANAVAERYYGALRKNDLEGVIGTLDQGCRAEVPGGTLDGAEQVRGWMGSFFDAFPDIEHSIGDLDVAAQSVSADVRVTGTHTE